MARKPHASSKPLKTKRDAVRKIRPNAGATLTAMWGWRIVDYGPTGYGDEVLSSPRATHRTEGRAWADAARRLL